MFRTVALARLRLKYGSFNALEKLLDQKFCDACDDALAHSGHRAAHLSLAGVLNHRFLFLVGQLDQTFCVYKARAAGPRHRQFVLLSRNSITDLDGAFISALDGPDTHFHADLVGILSVRDHFLAAGSAPPEDCGVVEGFPDLVSRDFEPNHSVYFHGCGVTSK